MATFRLSMRRSETKVGAKVNIKIRVTHRGDVRYIATKYDVPPDNFDEASERVLYGPPYSKDDANKRVIRLILKTEPQYTPRTPDTGSGRES